MAPSLHRRPYTLVPIAETGERFVDFAPYVASVNDEGLVAFQAALGERGTGVFTGRGGLISSLATLGAPPAGVRSHPDINNAGSACFYATTDRGAEVRLVCADRMDALSTTAGLLGPTINEHDVVAFRADLGSDVTAIRTGSGGPITTIADTSGCLSAFHGLPVINNLGLVAFRADLKAGGQMIGVGDGSARTAIATTGDVYSDLGRFPDMNDTGAVVFCATGPDERSGIFRAVGGDTAALIDTRASFESFRSALINNEGVVVFAAAPRGGTLGVFTGPDPHTDRVIAIGMALFGSEVADFALNPVSFNNAAQIALRVGLADGRQLILRADPV